MAVTEDLEIPPCQGSCRLSICESGPDLDELLAKQLGVKYISSCMIDVSYASQHNYICSSNRNTTFPYYLCKLLVSLEVLVLLGWTFRQALSLSSIVSRD